MKKQILSIVLAGLLTACAMQQVPQTLGDVKGGLECISFKEDLLWYDVFKKFGDPNVAPLPEPGSDLGKNSRVYKNSVVIFYVDDKEVSMAGKTRFKEVVKMVEVCTKK